MSELRHDPLNRRWIIVASDRALRPTDFVFEPSPPSSAGACPFCEGHEEQTPPEITSRRQEGEPNQPGWTIRVIPNRYPALAIEGSPDRKGVGLYDRMRGIGAHEVIIEAPRHEADWTTYSPEHAVELLAVYRERIADLMNDRRFKYILLFKNHGSAAGATLSHPHAQIIALPVNPRAISVELEASFQHHRLKERCLLCDTLEQEIEDGRRIVALTEDFVAWAPYASRFPFEVQLAPRRHAADFAALPDTLLSPLAGALTDVLKRLHSVLRDPPYNFVLHTAPSTQALPPRTGYWETLAYDWHWHVEILPRITRVAGFEWGTGFYINPTPPEDAASFLREAHE